MSLQTTTNLSNAVGTRYTQKYQRAARVRRLYDQLAVPIGAPQFDLETRRGLGTTYTFNHISDMTPGTTAISETVDIDPQILRDATSTITPTSRGEALKWSELVDIEAYTDYAAARAEALGDNAMETIDNMAKAAALQGSLVIRAEARATLDSVDTGSYWSEAAIWKAAAMVADLKCPPFISPDGQRKYLAIAHTDAYYDLFHGGNVISAVIYGGLPGNILFNGEIGEIAGFKLLISPWAKVFGGAGEDNDTGSSQTYVLSAAAKALDTTLSVTTGTNVVNGRYITVGIEETGDTHYDTNERVRWISGTTTATIVGSGANGGLRFDHPATTHYALNADSVYPVAYGAPGSLVKVYANETGEFGEVVGPKFDGVANQWQQIAWKYYGGVGRMAENYIVRGEYSCSLDDVA
jgi:N4-gp56 family major capsid protein